MRESDRKSIKFYLQELNKETENQLHNRILEAANATDGDFLNSMENELGKYLLELLNAEN